MIAILSILLLLLAAMIAVPVVVLSLECLVAVWSGAGTHRDNSVRRPSVVVLLPAHNEAKGIVATIETILPQLAPNDRLIVVADNCDDATADVALKAGATIIERHDAVKRGKGYALDCGVRSLAASPPEVVVMADADCHLNPGSLELLATQAVGTGRPAQAVYLMEAPANPSPRDMISAFAFLVKNEVRPMGLGRAGLPCLLTGTGMAFPWELIRDAPLASGNIVEDMQLGLDLALTGHGPLLCPEARVIGQLPSQNSAAKTQRRRWEHGHLLTLVRMGPKLLVQGILRGKLDLVALALDLCVPPLSLLVVLWSLTMGSALLGRILLRASWLPVMVLAGIGVLLFVSVLASWFRFGRTTIRAATLLAIPFYVICKLPLYLAFLFRRQKAWVRTAR